MGKRAQTVKSTTAIGENTQQSDHFHPLELAKAPDQRQHPAVSERQGGERKAAEAQDANRRGIWLTWMALIAGAEYVRCRTSMLWRSWLISTR